jgi:hypothetical protein
MKKLLLTLITITTLIACKKNEPIEPKQNTQNVVTCNLEGKVTNKYFIQKCRWCDYTFQQNHMSDKHVEIIDGEPTYVSNIHVYTEYYIIAQYGQLQPVEKELNKIDFDKYNVNDKYCLD